MGNQWFFARGTTQFGPVEEAFLYQMAERGELGPDDLLWQPGLDSWVRADSLAGLFAPPPLPHVVAGHRASAQLPSTGQAHGRSVAPAGPGKPVAGRAPSASQKAQQATDVPFWVVIAALLAGFLAMSAVVWLSK